MTEGAGGGTISTTALYNGFYEVVRETLNIKFIRACEAIINEGISNIHTMTDVTNGGIRGDANEIAKVAGVKLVLYEDKIRELVNKKVLDMLNRLKIDYLGVSLDALLVICPEDVAACVREAVERAGVKISEVGFVEEASSQGGSAEIVVGGERNPLVPKFRESAYTPLKKVVGESVSDAEFEEMARRVELAAKSARAKKERVKKWLLSEGAK
ncbi:MAG: Hydrogenase maturation factor HypE [Methanophagales archaeon]|nr:AIR synthase-related protein [Methanophagales archaeon]MCU4140315.1 Hydrogenase maturation factor HypE [Methanophagales archaeon]